MWFKEICHLVVDLLQCARQCLGTEKDRPRSVEGGRSQLEGRCLLLENSF